MYIVSKIALQEDYGRPDPPFDGVLASVVLHLRTGGSDSFAAGSVLAERLNPTAPNQSEGTTRRTKAPFSFFGTMMTHRVLVIDDDRDFRDALSELLRLDGLQVRTADRAAAAISELKTFEFDAVLSDIVMPGNGHSVVEYVDVYQPGTPVIVISSYEAPVALLDGKTASVIACLSKPVEFGEIREALRSAFGDRLASRPPRN
jgi:CheY-like chemotaxis protein